MFKSGVLSKTICLTLAVIMLAMPTMLCAQTSADYSAGRMAGEADANSQSTTMWFVGGCLLGIIGWLLAYAIEPSAPSAQLLGKSPEYVAGYTDSYKAKLKSRNSSAALYGCLTGTAATLVFYVVLFAAASSSSTSSTY